MGQFLRFVTLSYVLLQFTTLYLQYLVFSHLLTFYYFFHLDSNLKNYITVFYIDLDDWTLEMGRRRVVTAVRRSTTRVMPSLPGWMAVMRAMDHLAEGVSSLRTSTISPTVIGGCGCLHFIRDCRAVKVVRRPSLPEVLGQLSD